MNGAKMRNKTKKFDLMGAPSFRMHRKMTGFTLTEVLVSVLISVTLLALALPAMAGWVSSVRLRMAADLFYQSLATARSEAIKRNVRTVVCKSALGGRCDANGDWQFGWIVFKDGNGNAQVDEGDEVIHRQAALPGDMRFSGNTNVAHYVSYSPTGASKMVGGGAQMGTFIICMASGAPTEARKVMISKPGHVRVEKSRVETCP